MTASRGFHAMPYDVATCIYYTGMDPFSERPVSIARNLRDRIQRALIQFFKRKTGGAHPGRAAASDWLAPGTPVAVPRPPPVVWASLNRQ
jgi:hypothetical protein